jgi:hypothetical protein
VELGAGEQPGRTRPKSVRGPVGKVQPPQMKKPVLLLLSTKEVRGKKMLEQLPMAVHALLRGNLIQWQKISKTWHEAPNRDKRITQMLRKLATISLEDERARKSCEEARKLCVRIHDNDSLIVMPLREEHRTGQSEGVSYWIRTD